MTLALLAATPAHAAAMAAVHAEAFPPGARWGADAIALQLGLPGAFGLIAPEGGLVLARRVADEAEVLTLAVAASVRRRGIARRLLAAAMLRAAGEGARCMFLEVGRSNRAAQGLYVAAGFVEVGCRRGYYPGGEDALVMRAVLASSG